MAREGAKLAFISDPPREGFEAVVQIDGGPYRIRVMATVSDAPLTKKRHHYRRGVVGEKKTTDRFRQEWAERETRRIWRIGGEVCTGLLDWIEEVRSLAAEGAGEQGTRIELCGL